MTEKKEDLITRSFRLQTDPDTFNCKLLYKGVRVHSFTKEDIKDLSIRIAYQIKGIIAERVCHTDIDCGDDIFCPIKVVQIIENTYNHIVKCSNPITYNNLKHTIGVKRLIENIEESN